MKRNHILAVAALAASAAGFAQAQAVVYDVATGERVIIIETRSANGAALHTGGTSWEDQALADRVADAMASERRISRPGMTSTIVANRGEVTISGSADSFEQAQRAELAAKRAAGPNRVVGMISTTSG